MQSSISVNLNIESHSSRTLYNFPCQNLVNEILGHHVETTVTKNSKGAGAEMEHEDLKKHSNELVSYTPGNCSRKKEPCFS